MNAKTNWFAGLTLGAMLASGYAGASVSADGYSQALRNGDRTVLVWHGTGQVTVNEPCMVEVLLIGGGGGGGSDQHSDQSASMGGGGAGGFIHREFWELQAGTYDIAVGSGGEVGYRGGDTTAFGLTAYGGGSGGWFLCDPGATQGGSGGGATRSYDLRHNFAYGADPIDNAQGNRGGGVQGMYCAGGGGGAGSPGEDSEAGAMTAGGDGLPCAITGAEVWYAGGGGGYRMWDANLGGPVRAAGGKGGGGKGGSAGVDGLGGGGGGGAKGGNGVVILSFEGFLEGVESEFNDATGGTVTDFNGYRIHTFSEDGVFTIPHDGVVELLLVGGGGGGGGMGATSDMSATVGGGGAGGFVHCGETILTGGVYRVSVGAGGAVNACGGDTAAFGLTAYGGGNGGGYNREPPPGGGGSGGGASSSWTGGSAFAEGAQPKDAAQGNRGGRSRGFYSCGGGGGAGAAGADTDEKGGVTAGGDGLACSITGTEVWYAGGGGGYRNWDSAISSPVCAAGGAGGGGKGGSAGVDGLGGGGGGNAKGGSGVVIVRYKKPPPQIEFCDATGGTIRNVNGYRIHTFSEDGVFTIPHDGVVELLLVGGGGGGGDMGTSDMSAAVGGGGAGGFVHCGETILTGGVYQVSVGAGGAVNACGGDTVAFGLTAYGGGNGGGYNREPPPRGGGSGGGASSSWTGASAFAEGAQPKDAAQGNRGGRSHGFYSCGGGGGAGAPGADTDEKGGVTAGGDGLTCSITGTEVWYAGGGGGYRNWDSAGPVCAAGGKGGGGKGGSAGVDGLGGGGGGNAKGGSGVVIVRYKKPTTGMIMIVR